MKALIASAVAFVALAIGTAQAAPKNYELTFSADPVQVGDTYTVYGSGFEPGNSHNVCALYSTSWVCKPGAVAADGTLAVEFTALDRGSTGTVQFGHGKPISFTEGEVNHLAWVSSKPNCSNSSQCLQPEALTTLTVEP